MKYGGIVIGNGDRTMRYGDGLMSEGGRMMGEGI